ncbi:MAG: hypothetical protein BWZ07_00269 [Alphaproteobacteria bacterium ADurb.BinA280]|jgi:hypothetical protein|nr:ATP-dependent zinc protease [Xanthomonadales bacterium]MCC6506776.1 ATP-dependent zinc protease [Aquimonas sp.]OPZ13757.1 MAG: hypothetical protein BWZ07_00269 [Alphaproteobacteria bacterium ADurb.BinA280]
MQDLPILGWCEWLALPDLGLARIEAKIDTGARSSCLHAEWWQVFQRDDTDWVRFALRTEHAQLHEAEAQIIDRRAVRDSGGHVTDRLFFHTRVQIGTDAITIEVNLANRQNLRYPMLLGRTALAGRYRVDAQQRYLLSSGQPDVVACHPFDR